MSTRKQKPSPPKPKTPRDCALYRAKLSCKIGRDTIDGVTEPPGKVTILEYPAFCALNAIEDIATALAEEKKP